MCRNKNDNELKSVVIATVAVTSLIAIATSAIFLKHHIERKRAGGKLVKVNYLYSKEFDV